jgi:hypothetical protein
LRPNRPQGNDRDLLDLANLLVSWPYEHPLPKPRMIPQKEIKTADSPTHPLGPRQLRWVLIEELYESNSRTSLQLALLLRNRDEDPRRGRHRRKTKEIDWPTYLRDYDAIVLVWTEIAYEFDSCVSFEAIDKALD